MAEQRRNSEMIFSILSLMRSMVRIKIGLGIHGVLQNAGAGAESWLPPVGGSRGK
jgi:hypothetical protein